MGSSDYGATDLLIMLSAIRSQRFPVMDFSLSPMFSGNDHHNKQHTISLYYRKKGMGLRKGEHTV